MYIMHIITKCIFKFILLRNHPNSFPCFMSLQLTGLSVSNGKDQLVVFHTKDNKDLIVCLFSKQPTHESRIGELVGVLVNHFKR